MHTRCGLLLFGVLLAGNALAGGMPDGPVDADASASFASIKQHLLRSHTVRIQILQQGQACLLAAQRLEALRGCLHVEREAMRALAPARRRHDPRKTLPTHGG